MEYQHIEKARIYIFAVKTTTRIVSFASDLYRPPHVLEGIFVARRGRMSYALSSSLAGE
jgi:hypothetical protein